MATAASNSLLPHTPNSLIQPRKISHTLSISRSPSPSFHSTRRRNSVAVNSLNGPNDTVKITPIETRNISFLNSFVISTQKAKVLILKAFGNRLIYFAGYPAFPTVMDINHICEIPPHRFPFLLVDRVIENNPGVSAVGIKNVTINDNIFPGHFPERPIMPGVLMIEAMAQVGVLVMLQPGVGDSHDNFFFAGMDKVRLRKSVIAGYTLVMRMTLVKLQKRFEIVKMEGKAYLGGDLACEVEFLMATGTD